MRHVLEAFLKLSHLKRDPLYIVSLYLTENEKVLINVPDPSETIAFIYIKYLSLFACSVAFRP